MYVYVARCTEKPTSAFALSPTLKGTLPDPL